MADEGRGWNNTLLGCFKAPITCVLSTFLPCFVVGSNHELRSDRGYRLAARNPPCFLAGCMLLSGCCTPCFPVYLAALRGNNRRTLGIKGSFGIDYCTHCFCYPCALTQENRELEEARYGPPEQRLGEPAAGELVEAIESGQVEKVQKFFPLEDEKTRTAINLRIQNGASPLIVAAKSGSVEMTQLLIQAKADIDMYDTHGMNPLIMAARSGHLEVVKLLLENKADLQSRDKAGYNVVVVAQTNTSPEIVSLLAAALEEKSKAK